MIFIDIVIHLLVDDVHTTVVRGRIVNGIRICIVALARRSTEQLIVSRQKFICRSLQAGNRETRLPFVRLVRVSFDRTLAGRWTALRFGGHHRGEEGRILLFVYIHIETDVGLLEYIIWTWIQNDLK